MNSIACFFADLKKQDKKTYVEKMITFHAMQIHYKVKSGKILTFRHAYKSAYKSYRLNKKNTLQQMQLKSFIIYENDVYFNVFIYDEVLLKNTLQIKHVQNWLAFFAKYPVSDDIEVYLLFLKSRFLINSCPDEIGIFLGYPIEDVISYVQNEGREFIYCKYWKVYHNVDKSLALFEEIDNVCEKVASMLLTSNDENKKLLAI